MKYLIVGLVVGLLTVFFSYAIFHYVVPTSTIDLSSPINVGRAIIVVIVYAVVTAGLGMLADKLMVKKTG